jgi:hypothetical protein
MSSPTTNQYPEGDSSRLLDLINGFHVSQAIYVVATLRIPDLPGDRPKQIEDLARQTGSDANALYRLLRALAAVGLIHEDAGRRFSLTSVGRLLRSDVPRSRAAWARYAARLPVWQPWGHLPVIASRSQLSTGRCLPIADARPSGLTCMGHRKAGWSE